MERLATQENGLSNSRERIGIRENELSNSRERITNPWERITNRWDDDLLMTFFENPHVPSGLSLKYSWVIYARFTYKYQF